jgi:hypothetical protein
MPTWLGSHSNVHPECPRTVRCRTTPGCPAAVTAASSTSKRVCRADNERIERRKQGLIRLFSVYKGTFLHPEYRRGVVAEQYFMGPRWDRKSLL